MKRNSQNGIKTRRRQLRSLADLEPLVDIPNGVQIKFRLQGKYAKLNDVRGTLIEIRRTRAVIDFGGNEVLSCPISAVQPANEGERG